MYSPFISRSWTWAPAPTPPPLRHILLKYWLKSNKNLMYQSWRHSKCGWRHILKCLSYRIRQFTDHAVFLLKWFVLGLKIKAPENFVISYASYFISYKPVLPQLTQGSALFPLKFRMQLRSQLAKHTFRPFIKNILYEWQESQLFNEIKIANGRFLIRTKVYKIVKKLI